MRLLVFVGIRCFPLLFLWAGHFCSYGRVAGFGSCFPLTWGATKKSKNMASCLIETHFGMTTKVFLDLFLE